MTTAVVLCTRVLRVHDHPALAAACRAADRVAVLFVVDEAITGGGLASPTRAQALLQALADLRAALRARGGELHVRRGDPAAEAVALATELGADQVHASADVSAHARRRERRLQARGRAAGVAVALHPGVTAVPPDALRASGGGPYLVFSAYWRRWAQTPVRAVDPAPARVPRVDGQAPGELPELAELAAGRPAPEAMAVSETEARCRLDAWLADGIAGYEDGPALGETATSRLSPQLHLGTISPLEIVARLDRRRRGHEAFERQLCWREFSHQLLLARPELPRRDLRTRPGGWRDDEELVAAWRDGRTGIPLVDAAMRQLCEEGWMPNRARMVVASLLTKHGLIDWRVGAAHFLDHLVDGDVANNSAQWQWVAGTGTDSRPNRILNPWRQQARFDPDGAYARRWVPELAGWTPEELQRPWTVPAADRGGYPAPIVDHEAARERFLTVRGAR